VRLADLERSRSGGVRYAAALSDTAGDSHYELGIYGPDALIRKVLANSEFEHWIEPKATEKDWPGRSKSFWERHAGAHPGPRPHGTVNALDGTPPRAPTAKSSIVVSVRRTEGRGTWWGFWWPALGLPAGSSVFFVLPPVCNCSGFVLPASGNPDLFLTANGPFTPLIAASTGGPGAFDSVAFGPAICWPWTEFVPWFRVFAVTTTVCSFGMSGFGVLP
jgi:hypothetical protein